MDMNIENLMKSIRESGKLYDEELILKAYGIADSAHKGQMRESGEAYISHPLSVAAILLNIGMDSESIAAALLHDTVEDTNWSLDEVKKEFGPVIAQLVDGVTKLGRIPFSTNEEQQAENVRKMLLAMSEDIRVIIIKLADRLHNMRTLSFMSEQKQRDKAKETMEVYAPIAHRLGMRLIKEELEDLSLRYLDRVAYDEIHRILIQRQLDKGDFLDQIKDKIQERITGICEDLCIESRVKSIYGIYRKMYMQNRSFEEIYDIFAIRIIVDTVEECYNVLGIIHEMYRLIPNRFKDYISTPKQNMYQSLHTTVIGKEGIPFEVQIRTWEMHKTAEFGIAAHWKYKVGIQGEDKLDDRLSWIRQIINSQQENEDIEELVRSIKTDLSPEDIFVLTPKGDIINLPSGSTVVDFAYAIHTAVGNKMIGAKVDGRIVPLDYQIKTGEIVEVITTKAQNHGPSRDWLKIVRTSEARGKIRAWFKKERREENIEQGKSDLERELKRNCINIPDDQMADFILEISKRQHCNSVEDLYAAIGYGGVRLSRLIPRIKEEYQKLVKTSQPVEEPIVVKQTVRRNNGGVIVEGIDNVLVKYSKCCNPLPGEPIVGFITRGYGVSVHRADCRNAIAGMADGEQEGRWIGVRWENEAEGEFKATLNVVGTNRTGILADVSMQLANMHIPIYSMNARILKSKDSSMLVTIGIHSIEQLNSVITKIGKVSGVVHVERTGI